MKYQEAQIVSLLTTAFQDEILKNEYYKVAQKQSFKKGALLIEQGQVCRYCQLLVSDWWMARFNYGPVEWLWRTLTYGKVVPLRK